MDRGRLVRNRLRGTPRRLTGELIPVALILAMAGGCVLLSLLTLMRRADESELDQQCRLIANALATRRAQVVLQLENVATSNLSVQRIWARFDPVWTHVSVGLPLKTLLDLSHAFVVDPFDRLIYAQDGRNSVDPAALVLSLQRSQRWSTT